MKRLRRPPKLEKVLGLSLDYETLEISLLQLFFLLSMSQFSRSFHPLQIAVRLTFWMLNNNTCLLLHLIIMYVFFQDIPTYCITLTLLVLCLDRHQFIRNPEQGPLPMGWILGLLWAISFALVLPYIAYITHVDLSVSAAYQCQYNKSTLIVHSLPIRMKLPPSQMQ